MNTQLGEELDKCADMIGESKEVVRWAWLATGDIEAFSLAVMRSKRTYPGSSLGWLLHHMSINHRNDTHLAASCAEVAGHRNGHALARAVHAYRDGSLLPAEWHDLRSSK